MLILSSTAVKLVLDGTISDKGILAPLNESINEPLMRVLRENHGSVLLTCLFESVLMEHVGSSVTRKSSLTSSTTTEFSLRSSRFSSVPRQNLIVQRLGENGAFAKIEAGV